MFVNATVYVHKMRPVNVRKIRPLDVRKMRLLLANYIIEY